MTNLKRDHVISTEMDQKYWLYLIPKPNMKDTTTEHFLLVESSHMHITQNDCCLQYNIPYVLKQIFPNQHPSPIFTLENIFLQELQLEKKYDSKAPN